MREPRRPPIDHAAARAFARTVVESGTKSGPVNLARAYLSQVEKNDRLTAAVEQERKALRSSLRRVLTQVDSLIVETTQAEEATSGDG